MDVYPYVAGSTVLREDLVDGIIDVLVSWSTPHPEMMGRTLASIAAEWGVDQKAVCRRLQPGGACYFQMHEDDVRRVITHPLSMIGSDGLPHDKRVSQTCNIEAIGQVANAGKGFNPDAVIIDAFSKSTISGTRLTAAGAIFRSEQKWYALAFDCTLNDDLTEVAAFTFRLGPDVTSLVTGSGSQ